MKKTMNLLYSQRKKVMRKKWQAKLKKSLPLLIPTSLVLSLSLILMLLNLYCGHAIKKVDEQLNQEFIFENLDQKKRLIDSKKEMVALLETENTLVYQVMENLPIALTKDIKLVQVEYQDGRIRIIGHCANQDEIREFTENLDKINGLGQTKITYVSNLNAEGSDKASELIWEFLLESEVKE